MRNRLTALLLALFGVLLGAQVHAAFGWSVPLAVTTGLVLAGATAMLLGSWLGEDSAFGESLRIAGDFTLVLGAVALVVLAVTTFDRFNGVVVAVVTIVAEVIVAGIVVGVHQALKERRRVAAIRRLASTKGWEYRRHAEIPAGGGPQTARIIKGMPADGSPVAARNIVRGEIGGTAFTTFDLRDARDTRTVWAVRLPLSLPYVHSSFVHYLVGEETGKGTAHSMVTTVFGEGAHGAAVEKFFGSSGGSPVQEEPTNHAADPDFAHALMIPQVREQMAAAGPLLAWWIEGSHLYSWTQTAATPDLVASSAENLAALVAVFPWQALRPYATTTRPSNDPAP